MESSHLFRTVYVLIFIVILHAIVGHGVTTEASGLKMI